MKEPEKPKTVNKPQKPQEFIREITEVELDRYDLEHQTHINLSKMLDENFPGIPLNEIYIVTKIPSFYEAFYDFYLQARRSIKNEKFESQLTQYKEKLMIYNKDQKVYKKAMLVYKKDLDAYKIQLKTDRIDKLKAELSGLELDRDDKLKA